MAHNKFLVGGLGNFINRNVSFINKKFDGVVSAGKVNEDIIRLTKDTYKEVANIIEAGE
jgi:methionyl-tRNA synthetase